MRLLRRPLSLRLLVIFSFVLGLIAYCYYINTSLPTYKKESGIDVTHVEDNNPKPQHLYVETSRTEKVEEPQQCPLLRDSVADIDTVTTYPGFDFQPGWLRTKEFWDRTFEARYEKMRNDTTRPRLKVIVVPHSHTDPGWLRTFEQYFETKTKNIINNVVTKLHQYPNMTFIWTEISFLNAWWETSHPIKQKALKKLIKEGRLEITTGGWVMPDEACTHIYALVDQFIEGHQWVKNNLGISPKTGWSIDPFGHGPTVPYLLDQSGLKGTIIQRIHYAWKQWLAKKQIEEFYWIPGWETKKPSLIVHNQPFDIYSIKSTCGPHPSVCLSYDFRKIPGEYSEYTAKHEDITDQNLHSKSKTLIEEYDRIGTLTPHNVVLVPLGDDFRYDYPIEFDAQYINYMKMFNYINSHKELFNAEVQFGTPLDYFQAMTERHKKIPSLKGDFFVYSDIFSEGKPAYWSGYYTTRPYVKILARQFEHQLRTAEILFTLVSNHIKQNHSPSLVAAEKRLEKSYEQLISARRNLGLFQHHDAITGTSKSSVMYDYGTKLFTSLYHCIRLQETALTTIMLTDEKLHGQSLVQSEIEWETYGQFIKKLQVSYVDRKKIILFNPLTEARTEVITIKSNASNIRVFNTHISEYPTYQINPNIEVQDDGKHVISETTFDVLFVATLPSLTAVTYLLEEHTNTSNHGEVFCDHCFVSKQGSGKSGVFTVKKMMPGNIQLDNNVLKLLINRNTGLLMQVYRKDIRKKNVMEMQFGAYQSAQRHSGAYLFMPDYDAPEKNVLGPYAKENGVQDIVIVSGPVSTEITTLYLPLLTHTLRIFNFDDEALSRAIYVENVVNFEDPPKNRETELFMRIQTDIQNGVVPEFYTDQNGFQYQKRVRVDKVGIEGNYYPITTMAWMQDKDTRLTFVTNHAQGASASEPGRLEVMLDRRTLYDDYRGIGEGVVDNKPTVFQNWLLLETIAEPSREKRDTHDKTSTFKHVSQRRFNTISDKPTIYQLPTKAADYFSRTLNYPINAYIIDSSEVEEIDVKTHHQFIEDFPPDLHLVTLRTITDHNLELFPSTSCFMVLQRPGYSCLTEAKRKSGKFTSKSNFKKLKITNITAVSLTGLKTHKTLSGLEEIDLEYMDVKTFKIRF